MSYQSDDEPIFSKNELREVRLLVAQLMEENEELRSKIIVMDTMVKKREVTLRKANTYIKQLEEAVINAQLPKINLN